MLIMKNTKRETKKGIDQLNQESIKMPGKKKNFNYLEILNTIIQTGMKEKVKKKKKKGGISQKTFRNLALQQKYHQKNKTLVRNSGPFLS